MCRKCSGFKGGSNADEEVTLGGDVAEKVVKFLYLGMFLALEEES